MPNNSFKNQNKVLGKNINLRDIEIKDAEFILELRLNENKNKYLNKITANLDNQIEYINNYKQKNNEFYFIIESKNKEPLGAVRVYDIINDNDFSWGSWIIKESAPSYTAIESALLIYDFAFFNLNFTKCHFEVRKGNEKVISFHQKMGAKITSEDEQNYYFNYNIEDYKNIREKYKKFLND